MSNINNYMTPSEAAERWGVAQVTVRNKIKPSYTPQEDIDEMINKGLIKYYKKPGGQRREWIISKQAMELWFGKKKD